MFLRAKLEHTIPVAAIAAVVALVAAAPASAASGCTTTNKGQGARTATSSCQFLAASDTFTITAKANKKGCWTLVDEPVRGTIPFTVASGCGSFSGTVTDTRVFNGDNMVLSLQGPGSVTATS